MLPVMRSSGLVKSYGRGASKANAVSEVSVVVGAMERVGVVGESGSGKSTLARMIVGLEPPDSGSLCLLGRDVSVRRDKEQRRLAQVVFQDPRDSLDPRMSILSSVTDFAHLHGVGGKADRRALGLEALERVGLGAEVARRRPAHLSGGQLQRACIARALVVRPQLLVADEPTSALDVSIQGEVLNLLSGLDTLSVLLISHDVKIVRYLCSRIYVMYRGRVVEEGPAAKVLEDPEHEYTRSLVQATRGGRLPVSNQVV